MTALQRKKPYISVGTWNIKLIKKKKNDLPKITGLPGQSTLQNSPTRNERVHTLCTTLKHTSTHAKKARNLWTENPESHLPPERECTKHLLHKHVFLLVKLRRAPSITFTCDFGEDGLVRLFLLADQWSWLRMRRSAGRSDSRGCFFSQLFSNSYTELVYKISEYVGGSNTTPQPRIPQLTSPQKILFVNLQRVSHNTTYNNFPANPDFAFQSSLPYIRASP